MLNRLNKSKSGYDMYLNFFLVIFYKDKSFIIYNMLFCILNKGFDFFSIILFL